MSTEKYKQVADLIEDAFLKFDAATLGKDEDGEGFRDVRAELRAGLMVDAAQAVATLALATEVRAVGLLLAAGDQVTPNPQLAQDAFTAAAIHLDLVEVEPGADAGLYPDGGDPADKDVEL